jgi:hypothetical protein
MPDARTVGADKDHTTCAKDSRNLTCDHPCRTWAKDQYTFTRVDPTLGYCGPYFHVENGGYLVGDGGGEDKNVFLRNHKKVLAASIRRYPELKADRAKLAATPSAEETHSASDDLIDRDAVARLDPMNARSYGYHDAGNFMPENEWRPGRWEPSLNDVNVCSANAHSRRANEHTTVRKLIRHGGGAVPEASATLPDKPFQSKHLSD